MPNSSTDTARCSFIAHSVDAARRARKGDLGEIRAALAALLLAVEDHCNGEPVEGAVFHKEYSAGQQALALARDSETRA